MISNVIAPKSGYPVMYRCNDCERHFIEKKYRSYFPYRSYETKHYIVEDISDRDTTADSGVDYTEQNYAEQKVTMQGSGLDNDDILSNTVKDLQHIISSSKGKEKLPFPCKLVEWFTGKHFSIDKLVRGPCCPACCSRNTVSRYGWIMF